MTADNISILDIRCPNCGAPAHFDIIRQVYLCSYCGSSVGITEAGQQVQGFRKIRSQKLQDSIQHYHLCRAVCTGCGAEVVFEENEALSSCAFCGSSMVRKDYLNSRDMPESVIPFALTEEEARKCLEDWCTQNSSKTEAKNLKKIAGKLKGYYLPYELIRGPVYMKVSRMDGGGTFRCDGYMNSEFVNRSRQLDNLLLDGMEPYDLDVLTGFDFGYLAGQRVKIMDLPEKTLEVRVREEASAAYKPAVRKVLQTRAVDVSADVSSAIRLPVLLPVYYVAQGDTMAAVNGQTGKVSVRAEKESYYYFLPWWLKAILATLVISLMVFAGLHLFGMDNSTALFITGMLSIVMIIITLCLYSDTTRNKFITGAGREIFTSGEKTFHREPEGLVQDDNILERKVTEPVFIEKIDGLDQPVVLRFAGPLRILRMVLLCLLVIFLPVIIALCLNGFDFARLELGGSAVWFCIMVPVVPVYLLKFGIVELYERPWVYLVNPDGTLTRYRKKHSFRITREMVKTALRALIIPPASLGIWFAILCFCMICYLTAFGF